MKQVHHFGAAAVLSLGLVAGNAVAGPLALGDTVTCSARLASDPATASASSCSIGSAVVGNSVEFTLKNSFGTSLLNLNFLDGRLDVTGLSASDSLFGNLLLQFTDTTSPFSGFSNTDFTSFGGGVPSVGLSGGLLSIDLSGTVWRSGVSLKVLGLETAAVTNVPEPGSLALAGLGLLAAVGAARRRTQRA